jgi:hypothetical protein
LLSTQQAAFTGEKHLVVKIKSLAGGKTFKNSR